jgi:ubiquinone/menaquinone biosynthesis C-methylase UbiE
MTESAIKQTIAATYDELALEYERVVVPIYRPMAKRLIQLVDLRPGWRVLDVGTGTGLVATLAAPYVGKGGKVIGIDYADNMLDIARKKADKFGFTQCEFRHGDWEKLEFGETQFDAALTQFALHHVDPAQSLRELHRVLVSGGMLAIHEWIESPNTPNQALFETLTKYRVTEADEFLMRVRAQSGRAHNFRVEYGKPETMTRELTEAGFGQVKIYEKKHLVRVANVDAFFAIASAAPLVHAELNALPEEVRVQLFDEARINLKAFETSNGFEWAYGVLAAVARK